MGISVFPVASAGGGIKSVQRGQAVSSGNIAFTSVDTAKTFVRSISEGASGTVATDSTITGTNAGLTNSMWNTTAPGAGYWSKPSGTSTTASSQFNANGTVDANGFFTYSTAISATASGGTTNLYTKEYGVYLSNSTTLVATGACRWEVVEFA